MDPQSFVVRFYTACRNIVTLTQGRTWYPSQRRAAFRIIKSVLNNEGEEIVIEMTRQFGKTQLLGDIVYAMGILVPILLPNRFADGFRVGCFAPKKDQSLFVFNKI